MKFQKGQKVRVKSLEKLKEYHENKWDTIFEAERDFLRKHAGTTNTISTIKGDKIFLCSEWEGQQIGFFEEGELISLVKIDIPKEMFEL